MNGLLIALLVVSALLNAAVVTFFIRWNKERQFAENRKEIIESMEEFVLLIEKKNEELFSGMVEYTKVRDRELEQRFQSMEKTRKTSVKEDSMPEMPVQTKPIEGIEPLYKQGFSAKQIAKVLKMEYGEVELAVNMLNKKKSHQI